MKKTIACILTAMMLIALCPPVQAAPNIQITTNQAEYTEYNGSVSIVLSITNNTGSPVSLAYVSPRNMNVLARADVADIASGGAVIEADGLPKWFVVTGTLLTGAQSGDVALEFFFENLNQSVTSNSFKVNVTSKAEAEEAAGQLSLTAYDSTGAAVPVPKGNYGDTVLVRIPLLCSGGPVHDIKISPVLSTEAERYPFNIDILDYTMSHAGVLPERGIVEFQYTLTLRKTITAGMKEVTFNVTYRDANNALKSAAAVVYVNVVRGYTENGEGGAGSIPKLMLESYALSADKIYAGDTFDVTFTLKNTSTAEGVQNIQIKISDPTNVVIPANNGSNSMYIARIGKNESYTGKISFQTSPDANVGKYIMNLEMSYEGATSKQPYTPASESITISLLQKLRTKIDEPVIYDTAVVGGMVAASFAIYNMGKSTIYNCMVDIEGDGLSLVESYFGGNVQAGGSVRPEIEIMTNAAGLIQGNLIVTYEDAYGEVMEERVPVEIYVNEDIPIEPGWPEQPGKPEEPGIPGSTEGMPTIAWIGIGVALAAVAVIVIIRIRKRRKRDLEDFDS